MKKLQFVLVALFLMICTAQTAFADAATPVADAVERFWPVILIAVAVIVIALVLWKLLKKK